MIIVNNNVSVAAEGNASKNYLSNKVRLLGNYF